MTKEQALLTQYFLIGEPPKVRSIKSGEYIELAKYSFSYDMLTDTEGKGYYIDDIQLELYSLKNAVPAIRTHQSDLYTIKLRFTNELDTEYKFRTQDTNLTLIENNVWVGGESKQVKFIPIPPKISDFNPRTVTPEELEKNRLPYDIKL